MRLKQIELTNFRSIDGAVFELDGKVRLIRSEYNDAIRGMASVRLRIPLNTTLYNNEI